MNRRADIDDSTIIRDLSGSLLHDKERRLGIDPEAAVKVLFGHFYEWLLDNHAGIIDYDVDTFIMCASSRRIAV